MHKFNIKSKKAIGYIKSETTFGVAQDTNIKLHKRVIAKEAERLGVDLIHWFIDADYALTMTQLGELDKALSYCKKHSDIEYLLVTERSQICPGIETLHFWEVSFAKVGVEIKAVDEEELLRWPVAQLAEEISLEFAEYLRKKREKAEKIASRKKSKLINSIKGV
jgi:hypothetical protein